MKNQILDKQLSVDVNRCLHCGRCEEVCWNGVLTIGKDGLPQLAQTVPHDEWHMCWECQRCLAVCPVGALSICGKQPSDSLGAEWLPTPKQIDALLTNRRSCRRFRPENVEQDTISHILHVCGNSPTGSCNQLYEYTVIDDRAVMQKFTRILHDEMYEQAAKGIYPPRFTKEDLEVFREYYEQGEEFCFRGAPHLLAVHAPVGKGEWVFDTAIALTYVELAMTCYGLGFVYVSTPWAALQVCPRSRAFLQIPENHYITCLAGFGKPETPFVRGVQRSDAVKINRITGEKTKELYEKEPI